MKSEDVLIEKVLIPYVPYFKTITVSDLPRVEDIRFVGEYNNNLIIGSRLRIVEYDPVANKIIRTQDTRIFDCNHSFTIIGNFIYAACNGNYSEEKTHKSLGKSIYKIDLKTGNAVKRYSEYKSFDNPDYTNVQSDYPDLTNIRITSLGNTIWAGVLNGVFTIDVASDKAAYHTEEDLGFPPACSWMNVWSNDKYAWAIPQASGNCPMGVVVFDPDFINKKNFDNQSLIKIVGASDDFDVYTTAISKDNMYLTTRSGFDDVNKSIIKYNESKKDWSIVVENISDDIKISDYRDKYFPDSYIPYNGDSDSSKFEYINSKTNKVIQLNLSAIYNDASNVVNGKRYIIGDKIYTLEDNSFPEIYSEETIPTDYRFDNLYVTADENYIIVQAKAGFGGMGYTTKQPNIFLYDLKKNELTYLIDENKYKKLTDENKNSFENDSEFTYSESPGKVIIQTNKSETIEIDLTSQKLIFK